MTDVALKAGVADASGGAVGTVPGGRTEKIYGFTNAVTV